MTLQDIKKVSIREYLGQLGINPTKENSRYGMYYSPFREDNDASLKVDYNQNLWIDYGTGEGGSIIDLVSRIEKCSIGEAIKKLDDKSFSFHGNNFVPVQQEPAITIEKIQPLDNATLVAYLKERGINLNIALAYCSEIHYSVGDKSYFAIGFRNDAGGWELRNKHFKGSISPKNITTINNHSDTVMIFEGFMDLLSYLSLKQNALPTIDTVVLNSIANLSKAIPFLQSHKTVHAFFDNDEAGRKSFVSLREQLTSSELIDQSVFYQNHKDLNDYWQNKSKLQRLSIKKSTATSGRRQIPMKKKGRGL